MRDVLKLLYPPAPAPGPPRRERRGEAEELGRHAEPTELPAAEAPLDRNAPVADGSRGAGKQVQLNGE